MKYAGAVAALMIAVVAIPTAADAQRGGQNRPTPQQKQQHLQQKTVLKAELLAAKGQAKLAKGNLIFEKAQLNRAGKSLIVLRREQAAARAEFDRSLWARQAAIGTPQFSAANLRNIDALSNLQARNAAASNGLAAFRDAQAAVRTAHDGQQAAIGTLTTAQRAARRGPPRVGSPAFDRNATVQTASVPNGYAVHQQPSLAAVMGSAPAPVRRTSNAANDGPLPPIPVLSSVPGNNGPGSARSLSSGRLTLRQSVHMFATLTPDSGRSDPGN